MELEDIKPSVDAAVSLLKRRDAATSTDISFIPVLYHTGQKQDEIYRTLERLKDHPALSAAKQLLMSAENKTEHHGFIGLAYGREATLFGLKHHHHFIGFVAINLDQINDSEQALSILYNGASHAFDTINYLKKTQKKLSQQDSILLPKLNQLSTAKSNLRADIFASFMLAQHDIDSPVHWLASKRAQDSITAQTYIRPEDYPFAIALDVATLAAERARGYTQDISTKSYELASRVTQTFDRDSIAAWVGFSSPAQNLAWSGYDSETILGLAVHSSPNPLVKATGHLVAEILGTNPDNTARIQDGYNPFIGREANREQHMRKAEEHFEIALVHAIQENSAEPLIRTANNQNEDLLKGRVIGWCAHALQAAGNAFTTAKQRGIAPDQATRMMFEGQKTIPDWKGLQDLNNFVMAQRRQGFGVTMTEVTSWCKRHSDMAVVTESLEKTARDPVYAQKLAMANAMPMPSARHQPSMDYYIAPQAPTIGLQLAASAPAPGGAMGGGIMGGGIITQPMRAQQTSTNTDETHR